MASKKSQFLFPVNGIHLNVTKQLLLLPFNSPDYIFRACRYYQQFNIFCVTENTEIAQWLFTVDEEDLQI